MTRAAICDRCGMDFLVTAKAGPLPKACPLCKTTNRARLAEEVVGLRQRNAELEQQLAHATGRPAPITTPPPKPAPAPPTADDPGEPAVEVGREALTAAVRAVANAQGRLQTTKALRHLASVAGGWARQLSGVGAVTCDQMEHAA